jgi:DNA-binding NarL/FixJ family response regulator
LGYIHKDSTPDDIAQTILDMRAGASPISPMIARRVLSKYRSDRRQHDRDQTSMAPAPMAGKNEATDNIEAVAPRGVLSPREQEVLALIARGFSYTEIARLQGLSVHTIQTHIKNLYGKLSVHSKSEAVFEATRMGLLPRQN